MRQLLSIAIRGFLGNNSVLLGSLGFRARFHPVLVSGFQRLKFLDHRGRVLETYFRLKGEGLRGGGGGGRGFRAESSWEIRCHPAASLGPLRTLWKKLS